MGLSNLLSVLVLPRRGHLSFAYKRPLLRPCYALNAALHAIKDEEYPIDDDVLDPHDAVGLADYLRSAFGAGLPPVLQDALAVFVASHEDGPTDAAVLVTAIAETAGEPRRESAAAAVLQAVLATAAGIVGGALTAEQPLMDAGLDSLGVAPPFGAVVAAPMHCAEAAPTVAISTTAAYSVAVDYICKLFCNPDLPTDMLRKDLSNVNWTALE